MLSNINGAFLVIHLHMTGGHAVTCRAEKWAIVIFKDVSNCLQGYLTPPLILQVISV